MAALMRLSPLARDPVMLTTVAATLLAVAVPAVWMPLRHATRIEPSITPRAE